MRMNATQAVARRADKFLHFSGAFGAKRCRFDGVACA
jgi:hypothetical protein